MTLMERLLTAGYLRDQMFNHESDLYIFVTPLTKRVVESWCKEKGYSLHWNCPIFRDQVSGKPMYDCAFQYDDYWKDRHKEDAATEFKFLASYAAENCFDEEMCRGRLRILWTALCLRHGLNVDTHVYDCYLSELWRTMGRFEKEIPDWSDFDSFELFMCKYLV